MTHEESLFYILLGLGLPLRDVPSLGNAAYKARIERFGIDIRPVFITEARRVARNLKFQSDEGRYSVWIQNGKPDDDLAQKIADAIFASISLVYFSLRDAPLVAFRVPGHLLIRGVFLRQDDLLALDTSRPFDERLGEWELRIELGGSVHMPEWVLAEVWRILPAILDEDLFNAAHFYQASVKEYCFLGDDIDEVLAEPDRIPASHHDRARAENSLQNAFKAVEAVIGDPPKDDARFLGKLKGVGINPSEMIGYEKKEPIPEKIRKMNEARDTKAAHGKTPPGRSITYYELMDFQACTRHVVLIAINYRLETAK